jgi:hypothetical protein
MRKEIISVLLIMVEALQLLNTRVVYDRRQE